jgi:hypothetical protein
MSAAPDRAMRWEEPSWLDELVDLDAELASSGEELHTLWREDLHAQVSRVVEAMREELAAQAQQRRQIDEIRDLLKPRYAALTRGPKRGGK